MTNVVSLRQSWDIRAGSERGPALASGLPSKFAAKKAREHLIDKGVIEAAAEAVLVRTDKGA